MTGLELTHTAIDNADRLRLERGISVSELARAAGITRQYFSLLRSVHRSKHSMSLDLLGRLAVALDVAPADLLRTP